MQKPSYYAKLAIEPLEYAYKNKLNPYQFNAIKYITRYKDKNGIEDLKKAIHCLEELIKIEGKQLVSQKIQQDLDNIAKVFTSPPKSYDAEKL